VTQKGKKKKEVGGDLCCLSWWNRREKEGSVLKRIRYNYYLLQEGAFFKWLGASLGGKGRRRANRGMGPVNPWRREKDFVRRKECISGDEGSPDEKFS